MASAGSPAISYRESAASCQTRTARVSKPNGRSSSTIGSSLSASTATSTAATARPDRASGRCTPVSTRRGEAPSDSAAEVSEGETPASRASVVV